MTRLAPLGNRLYLLVERPFLRLPPHAQLVRALGLLGALSVAVGIGMEGIADGGGPQAARLVVLLLGAGSSLTLLATPARLAERRTVAAAAVVASLGLAGTYVFSTGGIDSPYHAVFFAIQLVIAATSSTGTALLAGTGIIAFNGASVMLPGESSGDDLAVLLTDAAALLIMTLVVARLAGVSRREIARLRRREVRVRRNAARRREESMTDVLTGLGNRRSFERHLEGEAGSIPPSAPRVIIFFDVDRLKELNDVHGHGAGDRALVAIAEELRGRLRPADVAFRVAGDEFAILADADEAGEWRRLARPLHVAVAGLGDVSAAAGTAQLDARTETSEALGRADDDLYRAKAARRRERELGGRAVATPSDSTVSRGTGRPSR